MLEHMRKRPTEDLVTLSFRVHRTNAERVKRYVQSIEGEGLEASIPWRESFMHHFPTDSIPAACLRGSRDKEGMTQVQLAEVTGIPRRHISEMEHGKRSIGKEAARKLAVALKTDYRVFL